MIKEEDFEYMYNSFTDEEKQKFNDSTILITGCAGFIGYYMMCFLDAYSEKLGIKKIIGLDNFMLGKPEWMKKLEKKELFQIEKFDIITDNIQTVKNSEKVNLIIHMASVASPIFYRKYPIETIDANVEGLRSLLDYYLEKNIKGFLFFSTSEIYGNPDDAHVPTTEDYNGNVSCTGPRACYDESKRFGETICRLYAEKYNYPVSVVRPFNNYGPGLRLDDQRVSADFEKSVYLNKDIIILSDGAPTRTFCYIADAVVGYLKILLYGKYDFFNIGIESPELTIAELAELYKEVGEKIMDYNGEIRYEVSEDKEYLTDNPKRRCPNIDKAREILNYNPTIEIREGIERTLLFLKNNEEEEFINI